MESGTEPGQACRVEASSSAGWLAWDTSGIFVAGRCLCVCPLGKTYRVPSVGLASWGSRRASSEVVDLRDGLCSLEESYSLAASRHLPGCWCLSQRSVSSHVPESLIVGREV